ncbi:hypothetical protein O3P69_009511 [Scylla paramamosain]|uniref:Uncharacterized protein n=1 Tax=Scylla paramamosain TaxID=85552 RepID=A0AAW0SU25_SCYPA
MERKKTLEWYKEKEAPSFFLHQASPETQLLKSHWRIKIKIIDSWTPTEISLPSQESFCRYLAQFPAFSRCEGKVTCKPK